MRTKDIAEKYGFDSGAFEDFLMQNDKRYTTSGFLGLTVEVSESDADEYAEEFMKLIEEEEAEEVAWVKEKQAELKARKEEEKRKKTAMSQMLISSGFSFEGYRIVKYSGYISGDDATQIPRSGVFGGKNGENLTQALVNIRRQALAELKEAAYNLGCNAVIGVDFDYITLEPETANFNGGTLYEPYIICVTANGNAVVIEKLPE